MVHYRFSSCLICPQPLAWLTTPSSFNTSPPLPSYPGHESTMRYLIEGLLKILLVAGEGIKEEEAKELEEQYTKQPESRRAHTLDCRVCEFYEVVTMKLEAWIGAILGLSSDGSELVRLRVIESLQELGRTKRKRVLLFLRRFLTEHQSLPMLQRTTLLKSIVLIVKDNTAHLGRPISKKIISLASIEMTKLTDVSEGHRETASNLLLTLGYDFPTEVFTEMQSMIQRLIPTNFYVMLTLANLCSENVRCIVPLLKPVLETILFKLRVAPCERMKCVFCYALGLFSKSILAYISDTEKAPYPPIMKDLFFSEFSTAYDILFHFWLNTEEPRVSRAVVEALGPISHLLPGDKVENELPTLIPTILSMYQNTWSDFSITKGLCGVLHTAMEMNSKMLVTHLECLLIILHQQICIAMDQPTHPLSESHQNKILCCFKVLTPAFIDQIIKFLLLQLRINDEQIQLGTLVAMKHLINTVPSCMESHKNQILSSMALPVLTNSNRVKGILAQVIYTMASHSYLELEGGVEMVEFIIGQCAVPTEENEEHLEVGESTEELGNATTCGVTDRDLRRLYEGLMERMTTTLMIDNVLWPLLLEFVIPVRYTNALATVCSSLVYLGTKKQKAGATEFVLNYEEHSNLPSRQALLTRLLTVSSSPYEGKGRGAPALTLLQVLGINIHPAAVKVWDNELPILVNYLQEFSEKYLLQKQWEQKLLQVLSQTLEEIEDEVWIVQLSEVMTKHIHRCHPYPQQKGFLYKCLGIVLQLTQNQEVVKKKLHEMLQSVQHDVALEREGVATGIGYCARTHLDTTLTTLRDCSKLNIFKKTASFYHIMKDQGAIEIMKLKSTLILCYGHLILHCPKDLILPRIETDILQNVLNHYNIKILGMKVQVKDSTMKLSLIKTITLMARAIPSIEEQSAYKLTRKAELLNYMQEFIKAEPTDTMTTYIRKAAMDACASLIILEPLSDHGELVKVCLNSVFSLPHLENKSANESRVEGTMERQELYNETLASLEDLLKQFLLLDLSPDGLQFLFKNMTVWIESRKDSEREKSMETTLHLLTFCLETTDINDKVPSHNLAAIIGCVVLRCSDPSLIVREAAIECLYILLYMKLRFEGFPMDHRDREVEHLKAIKGGLKGTNSEALCHVCTDIGKVLSKCMAHDQVNTLLFTISKGLTDMQLNSSCVASIVMNILIRKCGASLTDVPGMIKVLYHQLQLITEPQVTHAVTHSISVLASHNVLMVLPDLLKYQIPFHTYMDGIWKSLLSDNTLAMTSIKYLLDNLKLLYDDSKESLVHEGTKSATQQPLAVICALHAMICSPESETMINILYPQLFSIILIYLSSRVRVWFPRDFLRIPKERKTFSLPQKPDNIDACNYAAEILQAVLTNGKSDDTNIKEKGGWDLIKSPEKHHEGVMLLASTMAACAVPHLIGIVEQLIPFLANVHERQRITVAAFFAELLNHSVVLELSLTDTLVGSLLRCLLDISPTVQEIAVKGLGNAAIGASQKIEKYSTKLLSAMIAMVDRNSKSNNLLAVEAMSSISKILGQLQENFADPILTDVALAIEPFFEHEQEKVRASAFKVLGKLIRFGNIQLSPVLTEHIHSTLTSLLLHLNDESKEVRTVCKSVLNLMGPLMGSENLSTMFQELSPEDTVLGYEEYLSSVSKHISKDLPDRAIFYITSCAAFFSNVQPEIRENAVTLIGFLMFNAASDYSKFSADPICEEIITLLSDPVKSVRIKAVMAIQYLHMY
ncbi:maestro heat-like repeat-containing protein family member 1 [Heptranchias perlo]|uniref:maestro heat-like repeat-containing protein family member 1 n=1 Tax=Heptranchias perlo TaxID=212740 RepID=UPI003559999D